MQPRDKAEERYPLAARKASVGYGAELVVDELDLSFPRAAFTALVGPNGSGKSTILRAFARGLPLRQGSVLLDGQSISRMSSVELARRVGILHQGPVAPEGLTVRDLVQQGRYPHRKLFQRWSQHDTDACRSALQQTGMDALADRFVNSLSGGQRQRAWIAMTLAQETGVLLLDEPTTFLDLAHQIEILDLLAELVAERGSTVIAVIHDINQAARYAHNLVLLKDGSVFAEGPPSDVISETSIESVFGVATKIISDPTSGAPLCLPLIRTGKKKE